MSEVKRYDAGCDYAGEEEMVERADGDFVRHEDYAALQEQLTATTNILKSAGIEADTVQAGVMELALMRDKMAAVARDFASTIAWADDVGALSMTELKRYDLDGQCEETISRAKLDIIDAADAYLNAVWADAIVEAASRIAAQAWEEDEGPGIVAAVDALEIIEREFRAAGYEVKQ